MGAKTDIIHNVQMGGTDDAQTGATTDLTHELQMGCADDAWTGAMTDISHDVCITSGRAVWMMHRWVQ